MRTSSCEVSAVCVYEGVSLLFATIIMRASIVVLDLRFAPHYSAYDALAAHTLYNIAGTPNMVATHARYDPTHRDLENNELTSLPAEIWQLTSLTRL